MGTLSDDSYLLNRNLNLVDRRLLNLGMTIPRLLNLSLDVHDGLPVEAAGPPDHVTGDFSLLLGEDSLDSRDPLPEDKEGRVRSNGSNVMDSGPESYRSAFALARQRIERVGRTIYREVVIEMRGQAG